MTLRASLKLNSTGFFANCSATLLLSTTTPSALTVIRAKGVVSGGETMTENASSGISFKFIIVRSFFLSDFETADPSGAASFILRIAQDMSDKTDFIHQKKLPHMVEQLFDGL